MNLTVRPDMIEVNNFTDRVKSNNNYQTIKVIP